MWSCGLTFELSGARRQVGFGQNEMMDKAGLPECVRSNEGLGCAVWQSKCNTFSKKGGELAILPASSSWQKG